VVGITNRAFRKLDAQGWKMVLQVHDFVGIEYPLERKAECYRALQDAFDIPLTLNGKTFTIPLDIKAGPNWRDMKPVVADELAESVYGVHSPARVASDVPSVERTDDHLGSAGPEVVH
jgi:hypothetical protein